MMNSQTTQATTKVARPRRRTPELVAVQEAEAALALAMKNHGTTFVMASHSGRIRSFDLSKLVGSSEFLLMCRIHEYASASLWMVQAVPFIARCIKTGSMENKLFTIHCGCERIVVCMRNLAAAVDNLPRIGGSDPTWKKPSLTRKKLYDRWVMC